MSIHVVAHVRISFLSKVEYYWPGCLQAALLPYRAPRRAMQGVAYFKMYQAWNLLIPSLYLEVGPPSLEGPQGRLLPRNPLKHLP